MFKTHVEQPTYSPVKLDKAEICGGGGGWNPRVLNFKTIVYYKILKGPGWWEVN